MRPTLPYDAYQFPDESEVPLVNPMDNFERHKKTGWKRVALDDDDEYGRVFGDMLDEGERVLSGIGPGHIERAVYVNFDERMFDVHVRHHGAKRGWLLRIKAGEPKNMGKIKAMIKAQIKKQNL